MTIHPAVAALLFAAAGCGGGATLEDVRDGRAEVSGEGVLVIAIDGLRWDHTSLSGYDRDTTPFLASLGRQGITFTDAWSPTPSLVGSHVAVLTGSDPSLAQPPSTLVGLPGSGVAPTAEESWFIPDDLWLLGQSFLSQGWNTAAFVDHPLIAELRGFSRGFRSFVEFGGDPLAEERSIGVFGVGSRFVRWANRRPLDENWFAYLHMHDLERVWIPAGDVTKTRGVAESTSHWRLREELDFAVPLGVSEPLFHVLPPSRASSVRGVTMAEYELRYDRGLRALDANLQRIVGHADEFGRAEHLTVVIVGSFGMELGEHGLYLQAGLMEPQDLRVPLVIRPSRALRAELGWDEEAPRVRRRSELVSLIDVAPTLVDLLGLPSSGRMLGSSMRGAMGDDPRPVRSRLFASSPLPAGAAVVMSDLRLTSYEPGRAPVGMRRAWSMGGPQGADGVAEQAWRRGLGGPGKGGGSAEAPAAGDSAGLRDALNLWKSLLLRERRVLHFGGSESDRPRTAEFWELQSGSVVDESRRLSVPGD